MCVCVRAFVRAFVCACVHACVHACVRACVCGVFAMQSKVKSCPLLLTLNHSFCENYNISFIF